MKSALPLFFLSLFGCYSSLLRSSAALAADCQYAAHIVATTALETLQALQLAQVTFRGKTKDQDLWKLYIDADIIKLNTPERSLQLELLPVANASGFVQDVLAQIYKKLEGQLGHIIFGHPYPQNDFTTSKINLKMKIFKTKGLYAYNRSISARNPSLLLLLLVDQPVANANYALPTSLWVAKIDNQSNKVVAMEQIILQ